MFGGEAIFSWVVGYEGEGAVAVAEAGRRCEAVACRRRTAVWFANGVDILAGRGVNRGAVRAREARARVVWRDAIVGCGCGGGQASAGQQCGRMWRSDNAIARSQWTRWTVRTNNSTVPAAATTPIAVGEV